MSFDENLKFLTERAHELRILGTLRGLTDWDQQVMMPKNSIKGRAKQISFLSSLSHKKLTEKKVGEVIKALKDEKNKLSKKDKALLRIIERDYKKQVKLPEKLVKELAEVTAEAQHVWEEAKNESNFDKFKPFLERIVDLKLQSADHIGYEDSPYDVFLDDFEEGMTEKKLNKIFKNLKKETLKLLEKIQNSSKYNNNPDFLLNMDINSQKKMGVEIIDTLGYSKDKGRLDEAEHPFTCSIGPDDVRITTHYFKEDFTRALFSTMHEIGHGLYEQGFSDDLKLSGLDDGISFGIHESQSRTWENIVGRGESFWNYFYKKLQKYNSRFKKISREDFLFRINTVKPNLIRIYADELTYNLHIILRFEIEKALMSQKINVTELPQVWNTKVKEYLGLDVPNDAQGVLQDVHWSSGGIGYFPSYTLGNVYAAQFWNALEEDIENVEDKISKGDLNCVLDWMRENIHKHGQLYTADQICRKITGEELNSDPLIDSLNDKFSRIYDFKK